ncbi:MAG: arsenic resistance protein [Gammaproteobacteria bacterium]
MSRLALEKNQIWLYLAGIIAGLLFGKPATAISGYLELMLWPTLALLLYSTFTQVSLTRLPEAFRDLRFLAAVLTGNFVVVPLIVWLLLLLLPDDPALRLGVLLVLLVPCTDWFITFTQLGRGDVKRAISATPINLLVQFALLPAYLWFFMDMDVQTNLQIDPWMLAMAFSGLILLPLVIAYVTERWAEADTNRQINIEKIGFLPVPLLTIVLFLIAVTQVNIILDALPVLIKVAPVFVVYLLLAALASRLLGYVFALPTSGGRTLAFSLGTRNSFVVLPLALALPAGWETTVIVIVCQTLVELFGMIFYLWWIPEKLFRSA